MRKSVAVCCGLVVLLVCAVKLPAVVLPSGTDLEIRLSTAVGTRISHVGDRVEGVVVAPVTSGRDRLLLQSATLSGTIEEVQRLGLGITRSAAELRIRFDNLHLTDGTTVPFSSRVRDVETAREHVDLRGNVIGIDPGANLSAGLSFLMSTVLIHSELEAPALAVKLLAVRSPDSEIYLPRGAELIVELTSDTTVNAADLTREVTPGLSSQEMTAVEDVLKALPTQQTELPPHHSSDLINLLLIGTANQVQTAFQAAGWTGENRHSALALYRMYHCMVQRMGYSMAPMSRLTLNGVRASAAFQKSLDTMAKRHHLRLWEQGDTNVWLGAASEDVGLTIRRMRPTHATDAKIDNERAKVINDLWLTGCVDEGTLVSRAALKPVRWDGSNIATDGELAVLRLRPCAETRSLPAVVSNTIRDRAVQAWLALSSDFLRANPLTVAFTTTRLARTLLRQKTMPSGESETPARFERPSVIDRQTDELACGYPAAGVRPSRCPARDGTD